ncbi:hypothetical protein [Mycoplasmopsis adleri]|uniref:hypothetical protein n=1 Tax=Mycoplasmopsis adleri TaxID=51362 RepID=UPI0038730DD3
MGKNVDWEFAKNMIVLKEEPVLAYVNEIFKKRCMGIGGTTSFRLFNAKPDYSILNNHPNAINIYGFPTKDNIFFLPSVLSFPDKESKTGWKKIHMDEWPLPAKNIFKYLVMSDNYLKDTTWKDDMVMYEFRKDLSKEEEKELSDAWLEIFTNMVNSLSAAYGLPLDIAELDKVGKYYFYLSRCPFDNATINTMDDAKKKGWISSGFESINWIEYLSSPQGITFLQNQYKNNAPVEIDKYSHPEAWKRLIEMYKLIHDTEKVLINFGYLQKIEELTNNHHWKVNGETIWKLTDAKRYNVKDWLIEGLEVEYEIRQRSKEKYMNLRKFAELKDATSFIKPEVINKALEYTKEPFCIYFNQPALIKDALKEKLLDEMRHEYNFCGNKMGTLNTAKKDDSATSTTKRRS